MDLAGGLGGLGPPGDGPGPAFVLAAGQVGNEAQQGVAGLDEPVQAGLLHPQVLQEEGTVLRVHGGNVRLHVGADGHHLGVFVFSSLHHRLVVGVVRIILKAGLVHIGCEDDGLQGQQVGGGQNLCLLLIAGVAAGGLALPQPGQQSLEHLSRVEELLVSLAGLGVLLNAALHHLHVCHDELNVDNLNVPGGIAAALYVDDVLVVKAADHMDNGVGLPDVGQELVAQALPLGGPLHQTGDVHKLNDRRGLFLGVIDLCQLVQTGVGDGDHTHIGVDGAEGIIGGLGACVGDGIEQGALAHVGQTHDT